MDRLVLRWVVGGENSEPVVHTESDTQVQDSYVICHRFLLYALSWLPVKEYVVRNTSDAQTRTNYAKPICSRCSLRSVIKRVIPQWWTAFPDRESISDQL